MKHIIPMFAIICITLLEAVALTNEIDGIFLAAALALIAGLGGYTVSKNSKP